jgi:hypothetical protein
MPMITAMIMRGSNVSELSVKYLKALSFMTICFSVEKSKSEISVELAEENAENSNGITRARPRPTKLRISAVNSPQKIADEKMMTVSLYRLNEATAAVVSEKTIGKRTKIPICLATGTTVCNTTVYGCQSCKSKLAEIPKITAAG